MGCDLCTIGQGLHPCGHELGTIRQPCTNIADRCNGGYGGKGSSHTTPDLAKRRETGQQAGEKKRAVESHRKVLLQPRDKYALEANQPQDSAVLRSLKISISLWRPCSRST